MAFSALMGCSSILVTIAPAACAAIVAVWSVCGCVWGPHRMETRLSALDFAELQDLVPGLDHLIIADCHFSSSGVKCQNCSSARSSGLPSLKSRRALPWHTCARVLSSSGASSMKVQASAVDS